MPTKALIKSLTDEKIVFKRGALFNSLEKKALIGLVIIDDPIKPMNTIKSTIAINPKPGTLIIGRSISSSRVNILNTTNNVTVIGTMYNNPCKK